MSFASDSKSEMLSLKADKCCKLAELSALLRMNGSINLSSEGLRIEFNTTNIQIARKVISSTKELFNVEVGIMSKKQMKLKKNDIYIITIKNKASEIINEFGLMNNTDNYQEAIDSSLIVKECCKRSYLRGAFLAAGSINSPKSSYFLIKDKK